MTASREDSDFAELLARVAPAPHDDDRAVADGAEHGGVGDRQQRRRVDDHVVEALLELARAVRAMAGSRAARSGWAGSGRRRAPSAPVSPGLQDVVQLGLADQHVGQPDRALEAEVVEQPRPAQVGLDEHDPGTRLRPG